MKSVVASILLSLSFNGVDSFNVGVPSLTTTTTTKRQPLTVVSVSTMSHFITPTTENDNTNDDDDNIHPMMMVLQQARQYAYSPTTTAQQAQQQLRSILELQSDCVVTNSATTNTFCDITDDLIDIVANLRYKAANQQQQIMLTASPTDVLTVTAIAVAMILHSIQPPPTISSSDVPFTVEEWRWAIRDGYFNTMMAHYIRHGGL